MKISYQISVLGLVLFLLVGKAESQKEEISTYLRTSDYAAMTKVEKDEVIYFSSDVTGDGSPELFFTKSSLRDTKSAYMWSIFQKNNNSEIRELGSEIFSTSYFRPSKWKKDPNIYGFYTYYPGGASQGALVFYEVNPATGIIRKEVRKIKPNTTDKAEYEELFSDQQGSTLELKRSDISENTSGKPPIIKNDLNSTTGDKDPATQEAQHSEEKKSSPAPQQAQPSNESRHNAVLFTILAVIVFVLGVIYLVKKRK